MVDLCCEGNESDVGALLIRLNRFLLREVI